MYLLYYNVIYYIIYRKFYNFVTGHRTEKLVWLTYRMIKKLIGSLSRSNTKQTLRAGVVLGIIVLIIVQWRWWTSIPKSNSNPQPVLHHHLTKEKYGKKHSVPGKPILAAPIENPGKKTNKQTGRQIKLRNYYLLLSAAKPREVEGSPIR